MSLTRTGMVWSEDILLPIGVKALGGTICSMNETPADAPTHIRAQRPLQISEERLYGTRLLALHPVKRSDRELRSKLRDIRIGALKEA